MRARLPDKDSGYVVPPKVSVPPPVITPAKDLRRLLVRIPVGVRPQRGPYPPSERAVP